RRLALAEKVHAPADDGLGDVVVLMDVDRRGEVDEQPGTFLQDQWTRGLQIGPRLERRVHVERTGGLVARSRHLAAGREAGVGEARAAAAAESAHGEAGLGGVD